MGLTLLHISDIHFRDFKENKHLDLDKDIQSEIELDLSSLKKEFEKIDVILIGGDIAFSGQEKEYEVADEWIKKICNLTGCAEENVLTVPGNHDIERTKITPMLKSIHSEFKKLTVRNHIDYQIGEYLKDKDSTSVWTSPLKNYFAFAQKYGSLPEKLNKLHWEKSFNLDGHILKINGLNSAMVSSELDHKDTSKLIVGSQQSLIARENGVINIVLCHHPPDWLIDGEDVRKDLKARARILLFGHKHEFDTELIDQKCLILSAGAMQPSRAESNWEPRYNIIDLDIPAYVKEPILGVKIFKRIWKKADRKFVADFSEDGSTFTEYKIKLSKIEITSHNNTQDSAGNLNVALMAETVIDPSIPDPRRRLAFVFLSLPYHTKLQIAVKLDLIDDSDRDLDEIRKTQNYFKRASSKQLLYELWDEVAAISDLPSINPFNK